MIDNRNKINKYASIKTKPGGLNKNYVCNTAHVMEVKLLKK